MSSSFIAKIKDSAVSVIPVMVLVTLLHFTLAPLALGEFPRFLIGGILLILGLSIFLVGADLSMIPFGQKIGSALTNKRSLALILVSSFVIGFAVTVAEPDVQVLADQITSVTSDVDRKILVVMIAVGVGLFLLIAMLRIVFQISLRLLLFVFYAILFLISSFAPAEFVGMAFDAGGATTGPVTVPFIMAMGVGVAAAVRSSNNADNSFGFVGLASIGPVIAVSLMGIFAETGKIPSKIVAAAAPAGLLEPFIRAFPHFAGEVTFALLPLFIIFIVFQVFLLRLPWSQMRKMILGLIYAWIGLIVFMSGVHGGFTPAGYSLGMALGRTAGGWLLLPVGFILGAVVVCAEPAVWVLTEEVEQESGGNIRRNMMLGAMSAAIAVAVCLGVIRVLTGLNIWYILLPGYGMALLLTIWCPKLFSAIAFDSGGVASGPMATTFLLSVTLGASVAVDGDPATDALGMVAMIAMAPLITIQIIGLIYRHLYTQAERMHDVS